MPEFIYILTLQYIIRRRSDKKMDYLLTLELLD
jgi:hypothetical protein